MERLTRRVSFSNVLAVIVALYIGVHCSGCGPVQFRQLSIPEAEPFVDDSLTLLIGARDLTPTMFHASVWRMVETCLGHPPGNMLVRWAVADSIIGDPSGAQAYGLMFWGENGVAWIILQRDMVFNTTVVSHEVIHAIERVAEGHRYFDVCTMSAGVDLPARELLGQKALAELRERAHVLRKRGEGGER